MGFSMPKYFIAAFLLLHGPMIHGQDSAMLSKIREEGLKNSRVMSYATGLVDGIGPRLTGSPNLDKAIAWALAESGLTNVSSESWGTFGVSWHERNVWMRMTQPDTAPLIIRAAPWSPSTNGPVSGDCIAIRGFQTEQDFEPYRGKLKGRIVLYGSAPSIPKVLPIEQPLFERLTSEQLDTFAAGPVESYGNGATQNVALRFDLMEKAGRFFASEGVAAVIVPSGNNAKGGHSGGTISVDTNYTFGWFVYKKDRAMKVPLVVIALEHYGRLSRLLQGGIPVRLELNVDTVLGNQDREQLNVFADIAGADPMLKDELVLVMAHLDSWTAGTGATDDGAGVIIAMEAMRILKATGTAPRRTIRLALWTGEEQGALGSRDYVSKHVAVVPLSQDRNQIGLPDFLRKVAGPIVPKHLHYLISAAYTLDAGGGKIRGVSSGNPLLVPIFRKWLDPLKDLGVSMVASRKDCGGDCASFDHAGIPAPSFKQDPLNYETQTHHTNMDTFEHLIPEDLRQAAVVLASVLYLTAMHDQKLPRLP